MKSYIACLSLILVSLVPPAGAQLDSRESVSLRGEVENADVFGAILVVVLSSPSATDRRADVGPSGDFEFRDLESGQYELSVTTPYGTVIHRQYVSLHSTANRISVRLSEQRVERRNSGTVSVLRLHHKVPSKARKEFEKGVEAARKNDSAVAIAHFTRATELDPRYMEAHNNLGAQHLKANGTEAALAEFQKAVEIDPGAAAPHVNLGLALIRMGRFSEAETAERKAIRLEGSNANARYFLGLALSLQQKNSSEALDNLQRVCETIPRARLAIADIVEKQGDIERAKKELRAYLSSGKPQDRQTVETWLAGLQ